jgi:hypothetical protein
MQRLSQLVGQLGRKRLAKPILLDKFRGILAAYLALS